MVEPSTQPVTGIRKSKNQTDSYSLDIVADTDKGPSLFEVSQEIINKHDSYEEND